MWRLWFISTQSHLEQKRGEFLGRAYASKSYCVQPLYWFCYCLSIIECSSEKQNEINKNNHVPRKYFLIVGLILSLSRLLDLSADTPPWVDNLGRASTAALQSVTSKTNWVTFVLNRHFHNWPGQAKSPLFRLSAHKRWCCITYIFNIAPEMLN